MLFAKGIAKSALVLGFAGAVASGGMMIGGMTPALAQININVPGLHVHIGRHHRYYGPPPAPYYGGGYGYGGGYNPCSYGFTVQDGVCKPYRGY